MTSPSDQVEAERAARLGGAWLERGRREAARRHLEHALAIDPGHVLALRFLGYVDVLDGDLPRAATSLAAARRGAPNDPSLARQHAAVVDLLGGGSEAVDLPDRGAGKLRFRSRYDRTHHRSGWLYAVRALEPLHSRSGVLFESFLEDPFAWQHPRAGVRRGRELLEAIRRPTWENRLTSEERAVVPFREPWIGFLHNPPDPPPWFHAEESPRAIFDKRVWRESLARCLGLFTLSEHLATWVRRETGKPVSALLLATERPAVTFSLERFLANERKAVVQIGWWLRRLGAIHRLPLPADGGRRWRKLWLQPRFAPSAVAHLRDLRAREAVARGEELRDGGVEERVHVSDADYDALLAENVALLELYDASASNTVVECLARATPLLVNPLPAVVEYLGADYPLYFADLDEAARKAVDVSRLRAAHEHLLANPLRDRLDAVSFRRSFEDSEVYRRL